MDNTPRTPPPPVLDYARASDSAVRAIAVAQRRMISAIVPCGFLIGIFAVVSEMANSAIGGAVCMFFTIAVVLYMIFVTYRLASALTDNRILHVVYALLILVPCVNLAILVALNTQATHYLQGRGIRVGLRGVKNSDLPPG